MIIFAVIAICIAFCMAGTAIARTFCKNKGIRVLVGILLGMGFIFVLGAVIFAGCAASMRNL